MIFDRRPDVLPQTIRPHRDFIFSALLKVRCVTAIYFESPTQKNDATTYEESGIITKDPKELRGLFAAFLDPRELSIPFIRRCFYLRIKLKFG
jgi:hypothetical protein